MAFDLDDEELRATKIMNGTLKEDIQVGEYVRINEDFGIICIGIGKVVNKNQDTIYVKKSNINLPISFNKDSIAKHSSNIIDIIEVGDIVKTYDVLNEDVLYIWSEDMLRALKEDVENGLGIKSIVTKEQFSNVEYKVGE